MLKHNSWSNALYCVLRTVNEHICKTFTDNVILQISTFDRINVGRVGSGKLSILYESIPKTFIECNLFLISYLLCNC